MKSENLILLLLSLLILYLLYLILSPFLIPIFWAVALVILFHPYYKKLLLYTGGRKAVASLAACLTIAVFIIVPLAIVGALMAGELYSLYAWSEEYIKNLQANGPPSSSYLYQYLERYLGGYVDLSKLDLRGLAANGLRQAASYAPTGLTGAIKNLAQFVLNIILAFLTMYFLFKDGDKLFDLLKDIIPLPESKKEDIIERTREVISASINGGVVVGAVQGFLGGLAFWFLDIPGAILWGFIMFIFSFVPSVGAAAVWGPLAIYLLISGRHSEGIGLFLWGTLVIGLVDNIMRPYIVGGKTNLNPMLLLFSILGAVSVFGLIGIIAGPLIISIAKATLEMYHDYAQGKNQWHG